MNNIKPRLAIQYLETMAPFELWELYLVAKKMPYGDWKYSFLVENDRLPTLKDYVNR